MRNVLILIAASVLMGATALAQPADPAAREEALAAKRAERDAMRAERLPSRPVTLRNPVPLPVTVTQPPGGVAAGESCAKSKPCTVQYSVPANRTLVVTALWSAQKIRCDNAKLDSTPSDGQLVSPLWHCTKSLEFEGKGAGFTGYFFATPKE